MQGQLDAMGDDQRPWAKVEISSNDFLPMDLTSGVVGVPFQAKIFNVGHSPLFNARIRPWAFINNGHPDELIKKETSDCDEFRNDKIDDWNRGALLFPGENVSPGTRGESQIIPGIPQDMIKALTPDKDGSRSFQFFVYGCVDYLFKPGGDTHQTRFLYRVGHIVDTATGPAISFGFSTTDTIPAERIRYYPSPVGGSEAD
jgi:hypothetical protein